MKHMKNTQVLGALAILVAILIAGWWLIIKAPQENVPEAPAFVQPATEADAAATLRGSTWVWTHTLMSDDREVVPAAAGEFTLTFSEEGSIAGETDCNSFSGYYGLGENRAISFGPFAMTKMFCAGSEEGKFTNMVAQSTRYIFDDAGNLILLLSYDSGSMFFEKR